jgi:streptogrisin C
VERRGRTLVALAVVGAALAGSAPSASSPETIGLPSLTPREQNLLRAINEARAAQGAAPLRVGIRLQQAARAHSRAMVQSGNFAHGDWYGRLRRHGVRGPVLGETLAWGIGSKGTASAIVSMWLASPAHRTTMLRPGFRLVGVGVAVGPMAGFRNANVATADFSGT